jgi:steroid delta-isomerase-like uncharacterized protein
VTTEGVLDELAAAWSSGDAERLAALFAEDGVLEDIPLGARVQGPDGVRAFVAPLMAAAPDFVLELTARVVSGGSAASEWRMTGTHAGDLPGMPRTDKRFDVRGASILELDGEKIKRCSDFWDMADFRRQLGFDLS